MNLVNHVTYFLPVCSFGTFLGVVSDAAPDLCFWAALPSLIDPAIDAPAKSHQSHSELAHYLLHVTGLCDDLLEPVVQCGGQV